MSALALSVGVLTSALLSAACSGDSALTLRPGRYVLAPYMPDDFRADGYALVIADDRGSATETFDHGGHHYVVGYSIVAIERH